MKETGETVAEIAGRGMTSPLNRTDQKSVCASVLSQAEKRVSMQSVKRVINRLHRDIQTPEVATSKQVRLLADLKKLANMLFPAK